MQIAIYREEIANAGLDKINWSVFCSTDEYAYLLVLWVMRELMIMLIALRAVNTIDFMTAEAAEIPWEVLNKVMSRIINEVQRC